MKNRTLLLIATLILLFSPNLKAQSQIKGHVKNGRDESVPFVNVLLLSVKDSSMMKGAITDEAGIYLLDNIPLGDYRLLFKRLGYNEHYTTSFKIYGTISQQETFMINLKENNEELKSVTVSAKKPFIEQAIDRTIVNVANSIIGSGSTALEVLEKSPGITIDYQKELLQMRGKEGVIVQIDGKTLISVRSRCDWTFALNAK